MDVYSSFIHNFQNLEAVKMSFNRWMDMFIVYIYFVHLYCNPDSRILLNAKKKMSYQAMKTHGENLNAYY